MEVAIYLIPAGIIFGMVVLWALFWSIRNGQYDDLEGAANRILHEDDEQVNSITKKREND